MNAFRTVVFWLHLVAGILTASVVVVMSVTGVLLTYQRQITAWADRMSVNAAPPQRAAPRLSADALLERARTQTGIAPTAITLRSRPGSPAEVAFGPQRRELVNAYTGALLGEGSAGTRAFFRSVTAWHRTLAASGERRAIGTAITGAANLGFLFLVASGFYLWWPRNWSPSALRNVTWFRRRLSGKARDFNWHNVIGFWSAIPLFVVVLSGVVISYQWAGNLVYRIAGEKPPARTAPAATATPRDRPPPVDSAAAPTRLDPLFAVAEKKAPDWKAVTMTLPTSSAPNATISIDRGSGGQPQLRSQLVLDRATAREVRYESFDKQTPGRRARSILRFAHTGEVLGIVGQTIAGLVSLGGAVLAVTGVMLAFRRVWSWRRRRVWTRDVKPPTSADVDVAA